MNRTPVRGIVRDEMMPRTAEVVDRLTLVALVVGKIPGHSVGDYHVFRGNPMTPAIKNPTIGSVVNHEFPACSELPGYLVIGDVKDDTGYLPAEFGPFTIGGDPANADFQIRDLR